MTSPSQSIAKLGKFLNYVLGSRPDEFGLILDAKGYIKIKDLLKALNEDPEWRFVRQAHLNELVLTLPACPVEIADDLIRAHQRAEIQQGTTPAGILPKLLYTAVRLRAYPVIHDRGLHPGSHPHVVLCSDRQLAERLGRRIDNAPVVLTVSVAAAQSAGIQFQRYGETLYLTSFIPPSLLSGPPLSTEKTRAKSSGRPEAVAEPLLPRMPGSFFPDPSAWNDDKPQKSDRRRNEKEWKKDRRQARKEKSMRR